NATVGGEGNACNVVRPSVGSGAVVPRVPAVVAHARRRGCVPGGVAARTVAQALRRGDARRAVRPGRDHRGGVPEAPERAEGALTVSGRRRQPTSFGRREGLPPPSRPSGRSWAETALRRLGHR